MKKNLLTVFLSFAAVGVFAQGVVQFRNYWPWTTPPIDAPVWLDGATRLNASNPLWRAALIGGPTTGTAAEVIKGAVMGDLSMMCDPTTTTLTWVNFRSGTTPPFADGYVDFGSSPNRVVPGVDWGGTALVQMVAWQGDYTTWADAFNAWQSGTPGVLIGASNPLILSLPAFPLSTTLTYLWGLNSFDLGGGVPEPTTLSLGGLGVAMLLALRRRN